MDGNPLMGPAFPGRIFPTQNQIFPPNCPSTLVLFGPIRQYIVVELQAPSNHVSDRPGHQIHSFMRARFRWISIIKDRKQYSNGIRRDKYSRRARIKSNFGRCRQSFADGRAMKLSERVSQIVTIGDQACGAAGTNHAEHGDEHFVQSPFRPESRAVQKCRGDDNSNNIAFSERPPVCQNVPQGTSKALNTMDRWALVRLRNEDLVWSCATLLTKECRRSVFRVIRSSPKESTREFSSRGNFGFGDSRWWYSDILAPYRINCIVLTAWI